MFHIDWDVRHEHTFGKTFELITFDRHFLFLHRHAICYLLMPQRVLQTCFSCIDMFQCLKWTTAKFFFISNSIT